MFLSLRFTSGLTFWVYYTATDELTQIFRLKILSEGKRGKKLEFSWESTVRLLMFCISEILGKRDVQDTARFKANLSI